MLVVPIPIFPFLPLLWQIILLLPITDVLMVLCSTFLCYAKFLGNFINSPIFTYYLDSYCRYVIAQKTFTLAHATESRNSTCNKLTHYFISFSPLSHDTFSMYFPYHFITPYSHDYITSYNNGERILQV